MLTLLVEKYGKQGNFNQTLYSLAADSANYAVSGVSSIDGTPSAVSASASSVSFASSTTGNSTLTITATKSAANRSPRLPWKRGGPLMFCAVLLGAPFARRRSQLLAVLLTALAITVASFLVACGGSGGNSAQSPQTYTVTVTPTGSGTVMNPAAITVTVTVQ